MSSIKRKLCIVVLLLGISMQGVAQKSLNPKAVIEAFDSTVYRYDGNWEQLDQLADEICKKTNNNPEVLTGMANSFFRHWAISNPSHKDLGFKYINKVIEKHPKYAPAYLIVGNTYMSDQFPDSINAHGYGLSADKDSALLWFQQAINAMPQSPVGYEEYALALAYNMTGSTERSEIPVVTKLQEYGNLNPSYPVYLKAARILGQNRLWSQAFNCYDRVDKDEMDMEQLKEYAELCGQNYERMKSVSEYGCKAFPEEESFVRYAMISNKNLADNMEDESSMMTSNDSSEMRAYYQSACFYWNQLHMLSKKLTERDYKVAGQSFSKVEDWSSAISVYKEWLNLPDAKEDGVAFQGLMAAYQGNQDWDGAEKAYEDRIMRLKESHADSSSVGRLYYNYAAHYYRKLRNAILSDEEKIMACRQGDNIISQTVNEYNNFGNLTKEDFYDLQAIFLNRLTGIYWNNDDATDNVFSEGAPEALQKFCNMAHLVSPDNYPASNLWLAYQYLGYYNYYAGTSNWREAKKCFEKANELHPNSSNVENMLKKLARY